MLKVSIILPTYNGARYLKESVNSCFAQIFSDFELLVLLDSRTSDNSMEILDSINDPRLRVLKIKEPGQANALNKGFSEAKGQFWTWTHDDNIYLPDAIKEMVDYLERNPSAHIVQTWADKIDAKGVRVGRQTNLCTCFLYRAYSATKVGKYDPRFELVHDAHYWCRMVSFYGPIPIINKTLYKYRMHPGTRTATLGGQRALISLKMHFDLYSNNIYPYNRNTINRKIEIRNVFFHRLNSAALTHNNKAMREIIKFAEENKVEWLDELKEKERLLSSRIGWLINRIYFAIISIFIRLKKKW